MAIKEQHEGSCGDRNVPYLNYINVHILIIILCYSFITGGNYVEVSQEFLCYFLQLHVNL